MNSLSKHLFLSLIPGFLITLLVSGLLLKYLITRDLAEEFDVSLANKAEALMGIIELDEDGVELEVYSTVFPRYYSEENPDYFTIREENGEALFTSQTLNNSELPEYQAIEELPRFSDLKLPDGRPGRVVYRKFYPRIDIDDDDSVTSHRSTANLQPFAAPGTAVVINGFNIVPEKVSVTLAVSREPLDERINRLNIVLLLTGLLTTSVVVLSQRIAIRRAVKPILKMNEQVKTRDLTNLDKPITLTRPIHELDELKTRFNELMGRVSDGLSRERRFTTNMAHEIRTPIAELKTLIEVRRRWPDDPELSKYFETDLQSTVERMERLVGNMLALSRGDMGQVQTIGTIDIAQEIKRIEKLFSLDFQEKQLRVDSKLPETPLILPGADYWSLVITNLFDNAVQYSPIGSVIKIDLTFEDTGQQFNLSMTNPQTDLVADDLNNIFDRMWRKDQSRTSTRHSGIGLALVKNYVEALGCSLSVSLSDTDLFTLFLSGPAPATVN